MTDSDADADADAEIVGAALILSVAGGARGSVPPSKSGVGVVKGRPGAGMEADEMEDGDGAAEADAEIDPEANLLQAVDGAERNSSARSNV
jgi:hypothetical protein